MSARVAEACGYEAILLSGGTFSNGQAGVPDIGLITADDIVRGTAQICAYSKLPCITDTDDGYGETPLHAYRTAKRLAAAGAMAFTLDDTTGFRGFERWFYAMRRQDKHIEHPVVSRQAWLSKIKAALEACEGTDCMVIARTEAKLELGIEEAIERALLAREIGAEMTLIIGTSSEEEAHLVGTKVPGWKMWPDVMSRNGKPDVELGTLEKLGFNLVTCHVLEKGALNGMLAYGRRTLEDGNTVFHDTAEGELAYEDPVLMAWLEKEARFNDVKTVL
jgi:2-methylisocitrate lyase-like PEP mutase family enzyme